MIKLGYGGAVKPVCKDTNKPSMETGITTTPMYNYPYL